MSCPYKFCEGMPHAHEACPVGQSALAYLLNIVCIVFYTLPASPELSHLYKRYCAREKHLLPHTKPVTLFSLSIP